MKHGIKKRKSSDGKTEDDCKTRLLMCSWNQVKVNIKNCCIDIGFSVLLLAMLSALLMLPIFLPAFLSKILQLPTVCVVIIVVLCFLLLIAFCSCLVFLVKCLKRTKRLLRVVGLCVLVFGFLFVYLSFHKDIFGEQVSWDPSIFGIAVTIIALGIAFLTLFHPRESEAIAIDKVIKDSNSVLQELTTETRMIDKVVKDLNNKMQELTTKMQMVDKIVKDMNSKMQRLDTKPQVLADSGQKKKAPGNASNIKRRGRKQKD